MLNLSGLPGRDGLRVVKISSTCLLQFLADFASISPAYPELVSNVTSKCVLINTTSALPSVRVSNQRRIPVLLSSRLFLVLEHVQCSVTRACVSTLRILNQNTLAVTDSLVTTNLRSVDEICARSWARTFVLGFENVGHSWIY